MSHWTGQKYQFLSFKKRMYLYLGLYLVKMLDRIMSALDKNSKGEVVAVISTMINWR